MKRDTKKDPVQAIPVDGGRYTVLYMGRYAP